MTPQTETLAAFDNTGAEVARAEFKTTFPWTVSCRLSVHGAGEFVGRPCRGTVGKYPAFRNATCEAGIDLPVPMPQALNYEDTDGLLRHTVETLTGKTVSEIRWVAE